MGGYVIRGGQPGYERLKLLARARWRDTAELLGRVGLRPGMRCLDLGCGGGEVTFELALSVAPGQVLGIDMDAVKLDLARAAARERGLRNTEFRCQDAGSWSEPASYDLVLCRNLLQHLAHPVPLLRRMWAAVLPGGALVVEDADFDGLFCDPPNEGFAFFARAYPLVLARRGGDASIGRKLHRYFGEAGIAAPEVTLVQGLETTAETRGLMLSTLEATAEAICAEGIASEAEVRGAVASLAAHTADAGALIAEPRIFQLWSRRPAAAPA